MLCALPPATPPLHLSHDAVLDATRRRACVATSPPTFHILSNPAGVGPGAPVQCVARAKSNWGPRGVTTSCLPVRSVHLLAATTGAAPVLSYGVHIWR